jgi:hypothetical protein
LSQRNEETPQASASNTGTPAIRLVSRNSNISPDLQNPEAPANGVSALAGVIPRSLAQAAPQESGGLFGAYGVKPLPPRTTNAPTMKMAQLGLLGRTLPFPPGGPTPPPQIPMSAIPYGWKLAGPMLRLFPEILSGMMRGGGNDQAFPQNQERQAQGGVLGGYGDKPALPLVSDAPGLQPEIEETEAGRRRRGAPPPPKNYPLGLLAWYAMQAAYKKATGKYYDPPKSGGGGSGGGQGGTKGGDGEDPCAERKSEEMNRCEARKLELENKHAFRDDVLEDYVQACKDRATIRWDLCNRNRRRYPRRRFPRFEPTEWGPADEESWFNENRERLPPSLFKKP